MRAHRIISLFAATLFAALAPAILFVAQFAAQIEEPWNIVVVSQTLSLARTTFVVTLGHAIVLGLPLFLLLRLWRSVGVVTCALGGFLVGAGPSAVLGMSAMSGLQSASTGGTATVVNGVPTLAGWIEYAFSVGTMGLYGVAGGLAFWLVMRLSDRSAGRTASFDATYRDSRLAPWASGIVSVAATLSVFLLPSVVKDDSCHNLFRDGRDSIGPKLSAEIQLRDEDWAVLSKTFEDFGRAHSLSLRKDQQIRGGTLFWRNLNLCSEAGLNIDAVDQPALAQLDPPPPFSEGIRFSVYELKQGSNWAELSRELVEQIAQKWPAKMTFTGADGKDISLQEALKGRE